MQHECHHGSMAVVGLRELRQRASDPVRRVEAGEEVTTTVAGRASTRSWRSWADVEELFSGPADPTWEQDRDLVDSGIRDPRGPR